MKNKEYKKRLDEAYKKHYCSGQCKFFLECKKNAMDDGLFFNCARLGENYGKKDYPKVLVVGKEPVSENQEIKAPALLKDADNPHYRRTLYTLATLLEKEPKGDTVADLSIYEHLLDHFCLTNYFKCAFTETEMKSCKKVAKKNSGVKTNSRMSKHCYGILLDEIEALTPTIIIIQGKFYSKQFYNELKQVYKENLLPEDGYKADYEQLTKHCYPNGDPLYVVWAYHPTARAEKAWEHRLENLNFILEKLKDCLARESQ